MIYCSRSLTLIIFLIFQLIAIAQSEKNITGYLLGGFGVGCTHYNPETILEQIYSGPSVNKTNISGSLSVKAGFKNFIQYEYKISRSRHDFTYRTGGNPYWKNVSLPTGGYAPTLLYPGESAEMVLKMHESVFKLNLLSLSKKCKTNDSFTCLFFIVGKGKAQYFFKGDGQAFWEYKPMIYGIEFGKFVKQKKHVIKSVLFGFRYYDTSDFGELQLNHFTFDWIFDFGFGV